MNKVKSLMLKAFEWVKNHDADLLALLAAIGSFLLPLNTALGCIFTLCLLDSVTAIAIAIKNNQAVKSSKMRATVGKIAVYFSAVVAAFLTESSIGHQTTLGTITKSVVFIIAMTELKSILEHVSSYLNNVVKLNLWNIVLSALQGKSDNLVPRQVLDSLRDPPASVQPPVQPAPAPLPPQAK